MLHPEVKQVDVEQLVRDFFVIDDEFLLTLLEDADFLELCDVYGKRSKYIQENSIIESYNSNRILALRDSLGERYGKIIYLLMFCINRKNKNVLELLETCQVMI